MIKLLKTLTWIYVGLTVFTFAAFASLTRMDYQSLTPELKSSYDSMCAAGYCTAGQPVTNHELMQVFTSMILPVLIMLVILLIALYQRRRIAYYIALVLFIVTFGTEFAAGYISFPAVVFIVLLGMKPVREYFKQS